MPFKYRIECFKWSKKSHDAARMLAEAETIRKTAETVGVSEETIYNWKTVPEFQERIKALHTAWSAGIMQSGIANRARRMAILQNLSDGQLHIVLQRALRNGHLTGGASGLVVEEKKMIGFGEMAEAITEEVVDIGLSREIRATLAQAADEVGDAVSKTEISGPGGRPVQLTIGVIDDIAERARAARERRLKGEIANDSGGNSDSGESDQESGEGRREGDAIADDSE